LPGDLAHFLEKCIERRIQQRYPNFEPGPAVLESLIELRKKPSWFPNRASDLSTQVMPMNDYVELKAFRDSVEQLQTRLPDLLKKAANPRLDEGWPGWNTRLTSLRSEAEKPAQMTVALLGTMGSGKSTRWPP